MDHTEVEMIKMNKKKIISFLITCEEVPILQKKGKLSICSVIANTSFLMTNIQHPIA